MKADTRHDPVFMNVLCSCFQAPQSSIMNVLNRRRVEKLCLISVLLDTSLKCPAVKKTKEDNIWGEISHWFWSECSFNSCLFCLFVFPRHFLTLFDVMFCSLSNTLLCNRLVGERRERSCRKTNHVLWQSVHTLFKLIFKRYEKSAVYFDESCSLFTWKRRNV